MALDGVLPDAGPGSRCGAPWVAAAALVLVACGASPASADFAAARFGELPTGCTASLRGLSPIDAGVCWASGAGGTVLRTVDAGASWQRVGPGDSGDADFRDVHAFSRDEAVILQVGSPGRIFRTSDGGADWQLVHEDRRSEVFLDGLCFADDHRGLAFGDPIDGAFHVLRTADGGRSWQPVAAAALPAPEPGEAGFAASGTNVALRPDGAWIATGGGAARCLFRSDGGASFSAVALPLRQGAPSQGAFSIAFRSAMVGVAVGGDYRLPADGQGSAAFTRDGGRSWSASPQGAGGYRSAVTWTGSAWIAVGEGSASWSDDDGATWRPLESPGFHAVATGRDGSVWAAGSGGRVARMFLVQ